MHSISLQLSYKCIALYRKQCLHDLSSELQILLYIVFLCIVFFLLDFSYLYIQISSVACSWNFHAGLKITAGPKLGKSDSTNARYQDF